MSITLIIVILTAIISVTSFSNQRVIDDLIFMPTAVAHRNQWYRFVSCALIHADIAHLAFNMWSFYIFGRIVEATFKSIFGAAGGLFYILLYVVAQFLCLIPTYVKHKKDYRYRSLGASGAVSAVIFAGIVLYPTLPLGIIFLPFQLPGYIFGFIYLAVTVYLDRRGGSHINHSAHFYGALAGIGLLLLFGYAFSPVDLLRHFVEEIKHG